MVWIRTIEPAEAAGRLKEAYDWQASHLGRPTEFTQLGSLDAEVVHARLLLYRATERVPSKLTARQKELISYLTSILNRTPHCASLSRTQLHNADQDDLVRILDAGDFGSLDPAEAALARYTHKVTLTPGEVTEADIDNLRAAGFDDLAILDANNRTAHLNYTNRVANGLGLLSEAADEERSKSRVPS
ncbi:MAG: peroxidase-related enzyme [Acidimicrobiales bacterium]